MKKFIWRTEPEGIYFGLTKTGRKFFKKTQTPLNLGEWSEGISGKDSQLLDGLSAITDFIENAGDDNLTEVLVPHQTIAALTEHQASSLELPNSIPHQLRVFSSGRLIDNSYELNSEFLDNQTPVFLDSRLGSIVFQGDREYRIPSPLYEAIELVRNMPEDYDGKLSTIALLTEILGEDVPQLNPEDSLVNIRMRHVSGFSANVSGSLDDPELTPVLFARHLIDDYRDSGELLDESQQILSKSQTESFNEQFLRSGSTKRTYLLASGEYVYIDPSVIEPLEAFRKVTRSDKETRVAFLKSSHAVLASYLDRESGAEELIENCFLETTQFSDRVTEINEWRVPDIPFLEEESNEWGTEALIFNQVGTNKPIVIPKDSIEDVFDDVTRAIQAGETRIDCLGQSISPTKELADELARFIPEKPSDDQDNDPEGGEQEPEDRQRQIFAAITQNNFNAINYTRLKKAPGKALEMTLPRALLGSTKLHHHQEECVRWLIDAYNKGLPGVLIADDMGLGKTLQSLVFLAIYSEQSPSKLKKPTLIVAPTGLLNNWLQEIQTHLGDFGLGQINKAFGTGIKKLKSGENAGKETDHGLPMLNIESLRKSAVVLTTYESLRDYHISFAQIKFGVVVFDEIQKVKNPKSLLSRAATTLNSDFQIGLSGTPVENSLADLWTVMDVLAPGLLNYSLKDFMLLFSGNPENDECREAIQELHSALLEPGTDQMPPPVLRRMKSEVFKGRAPDGSRIPDKIQQPAETTTVLMPSKQEELYTEYSNKVQAGLIKMVEALSAYKRISLSPLPAEQMADSPDDYISSSARLKETFRILDEIHHEGEKVIIFLESRNIQTPLSWVLKDRYKLDKRPLIINGAVSGVNRQKAVNEFQSGDDGFNAIIISPKAGGVGLTLTAANHVLHLERWWNPAVEEQCNDRAYRIGQKKDVYIYTPLSKHPVFENLSFDLVLNNILERKRRLAKTLFVPTELSSEDFGSMFDDKNGSGKLKLTLTIEESYLLETGEDFEEYVAQQLELVGFKVSKTPRSWDAGCDLIAVMKNGNKILIQCKQVTYDKSLNQGVSEILSSRDSYQFDATTELTLITNSLKLTARESKKANAEGVNVITGNHIDQYGQELYRLVAEG